MHHNLIIFDFDGTILDSFEANYEADLKAVLECGGEHFEKDRYKLLLSLHKDSWKEFYENFGVKDVSRVQALYEKYFFGAKNIPLVKGVKETLAFLSGIQNARNTRAPFNEDTLNFAIVSCTRKKEQIWRRLVENGISKYFEQDAIFTSNTKDKSEAIFLALKKFDSDPKDALVVGDTINDVISANKVGCKCAVISNASSFNTSLQLKQSAYAFLFDDIRGVVQIWFQYFNHVQHEEERKNSKPPIPQ